MAISFIDTYSLIGDNNRDAKTALGIDWYDDNEAERLNLACNSVHRFIKEYTGRVLPSTSHADRYDGGKQYIYLDNFPVSAVSRVAYGKYCAVKVKNTGTVTNATVSVSTTAVTVTKDGSSSTLAFADYTTLSALETAINALSGWSAEVVDSNYDSYASDNLLPAWGLYCLDEYAYLHIPSQHLNGFELYEDDGVLYYEGGFPSGHRNVFVDYTAGFSTIPGDIKEAALEAIKWLYDSYKNNRLGIVSRTIADGTMTIETSDLPKTALRVFDLYRRRYV
jgi:hypothetical protein